MSGIHILSSRITIRPDQMGGAACIRGLRIVSVVVDMVADGMKSEEILDLYPDLQAEHITAALEFGASGD